MTENSSQTRPPTRTRSAHSEAYWQTIKYVILGLGAVMILVLILAVVVLLRLLPWG